MFIHRLFKVKKRVEGFKMNLDLLDGGISGTLFLKGGRERAFMSLMGKVVKEGMTCLDIGANIGYTTLHMLRNVGQSGYVYAVEPVPNNIEMLRRNVSDNCFLDRCEISQCVISNKNGNIDFWVSKKSNLSSVRKRKESTRKIKVRAYDLGRFLEKRKSPNFLKMDVEGHEVKIFEGGLSYFAKNKGEVNILLEIHPECYDADNNFAAILAEYFRIGFYAKYVISTPISKPKLFAEAGYSPTATVYTDGFYRGIYENMRNEDVIRFACYEHKEGNSNKIVRSFMLRRE